jgi:hypothetical protein
LFTTFFLQILVCALISANLWLKTQAQVLPMPVITVPALPQPNVVPTVGAGIPIIPGVAAGATGATGLTQNFGVSIY